jgi:hypothetical protein
MAPMFKLGLSQQEPPRPGQDFLAHTRTAVLNVLIAVGLVIAISGGLLRFRAGSEAATFSRRFHQELMACLVLVAVTSYAARRILTQRLWRGKAPASESLFYWSHVLPAAIAALAAPLGLAYGWFIDPTVKSVIPFWVVALALGSLALPRSTELDCFDRPAAGEGSVQS